MAAPTVLFIEDDGEISEGIRLQLEKRGYRVVVAIDETESMDLLSDNNLKIDLILIDQKMASNNALAAARRIREHATLGPAVPVVVIPFEFSEELEEQDESVGRGDYKSYFANERQLDDLLNRLLASSEQRS